MSNELHDTELAMFTKPYHFPDSNDIMQYFSSNQHDIFILRLISFHLSNHICMI